VKGPVVDRATGVALVLFGTVVAVEASTFNVAFLTDPVGPKALPLLVAVTLVFAGAWTAARPREAVRLPSRASLPGMIAAAGAFLVYAAALPWLGFFVSTSLVVTALALLYRGPILPSLASGVGLSAVLWILFVRALALPLPVGELWMR